MPSIFWTAFNDPVRRMGSGCRTLLFIAGSGAPGRSGEVKSRLHTIGKRICARCGTIISCLAGENRNGHSARIPNLRGAGLGGLVNQPFGSDSERSRRMPANRQPSRQGKPFRPARPSRRSFRRRFRPLAPMVLGLRCNRTFARTCVTDSDRPRPNTP